MGNDTKRVGPDAALGLLGTAVMTRTVTAAFSMPRVVGVILSNAMTAWSIASDFVSSLDLQLDFHLIGTAHASEGNCSACPSE